MKSQESMFIDPEREAASRRAHDDPREEAHYQEDGQWRPEQEAYSEASGQQQIMGGKIYPRRRRRRSTGLALVIVISLLLLALLAGAGIFSKTHQSTGSLKNMTYRGLTEATIILHVENGNVRVHAGNSSTISIQATQKIDGVQFLPSSQPRYSKDRQTITIEANSSFLGLGREETNFDITAPSNTNLVLESDTGTFTVDNIDGNITAKTDNGSLNVDGADGQLKLETDNGSVVLKDLDGSVQAKSDSGSIVATNITGEAHFSSDSGSINLDQARLRGQSDIETDSGSIHFNGSLEPTGDYLMKSDSGSVNLSLPASSAFSLSTNTDSGSIYNEFSSNDTGSAPRAKLSIETDSGSIHIDKE